MKVQKALVTAAVATALSLLPLAAHAQERNNGRERGGRAAAGAPARAEGGRQAVVRQAPQARQAAPQPQGRVYAAPPAQARPYSGPQAVVRGQGSPQPGAQARTYGGQAVVRGQGSPQPRAQQAVPRAYSGQQAVTRGYGNSQYGYAQPRAQAAPRSQYGYGHGSPAYRPGDRDSRYGGGHYAPRSNYYARPYYGHGYVRPYGWTAYRPYYFSRPYYAFSPWFSIGFGISIGYPVSYPYAYLGTYRPRVYGYYDNSYGYSTTASVSVYGGLSFDIQPSDADLWVDDQYVGTVGTFTPYGEPLTLTPGQHHIVVQHDGFRGMEWDVTVEPGQVIPYRGAMEPQ